MSGSTGRAALIVVAVAGLAACGGGEKTFDDSEPAKSFPVRVTRASFPVRQHVAATTDLVLTVTNAGDEALPQIGVTIWTGDGGAAAPKAQGSFSTSAGPVWVPVAGFPKLMRDGQTLDDLGPAEGAGADAAPTDSYALGRLGPRETRTVVWRATPVRVGSYTVNYSIAAGLQGRAKAVTGDGRPAAGRFRVRIDASPRGGCVVRATRPYTGDCA